MDNSSVSRHEVCVVLVGGVAVVARLDVYCRHAQLLRLLLGELRQEHPARARVSQQREVEQARHESVARVALDRLPLQVLSKVDLEEARVVQRPQVVLPRRVALRARDQVLLVSQRAQIVVNFEEWI